MSTPGERFDRHNAIEPRKGRHHTARRVNAGIDARANQTSQPRKVRHHKAQRVNAGATSDRNSPGCQRRGSDSTDTTQSSPARGDIIGCLHANPPAQTCSRPSAARARSCRPTCSSASSRATQSSTASPPIPITWSKARNSTRPSTAHGTGSPASGPASKRPGQTAAHDPATGPTREKWLLPLFQELGYGRLIAAKPVEIDGKPYAISHNWQHAVIHLLGFNVDLDRRVPGSQPRRPAQPGPGVPQPL